jgi:hypothetical protein
MVISTPITIAKSTSSPFLSPLFLTPLHHRCIQNLLPSLAADCAANLDLSTDLARINPTYTHDAAAAAAAAAGGGGAARDEMSDLCHRLDAIISRVILSVPHFTTESQPQFMSHSLLSSQVACKLEDETPSSEIPHRTLQLVSGILAHVCRC